MAKAVRLAMWSGPRNISTAMMRSWGNRGDTAVLDEPFYAFYLKQTGKAHPAAAKIIEAGETDWKKVVARLTGPVPGGKQIFFQKQMTHHLLPEIQRDWIVGMTNCFLIRDPREVILSYVKKNADPDVEDLGFVQQREIFEFVRQETNTIPAVVDADDVLRAPQQALQRLCNHIGIDFDSAMLSWPPGLRKTDGIWAKHWYDAVARSTSFESYKPREGTIPDALRETYEHCCKCYKQLHHYRLN